MASTRSLPRNFPELLPLARTPLVCEALVQTLDSWITPIDRFFIRSHFNIPELDISTWQLVVDGEVERPLTLNYKSLQKLMYRELVVLLECAGNSRAAVQTTTGALFQHSAVGTVHCTGVPLRDVLMQAGLKATSREVLFEGWDGGEDESGHRDRSYARTLPLDKALHPDTLLAYQMNGEPLSPEHGYPVRLIVPGWYGMASVKWLRHIQLLDGPFDGHYQTGYYVFVKEGPEDDSPKEPVTSLGVKSLVTWPRRHQIVKVGINHVQGVAWSGEGPILGVEVSTNGKDWHAAMVQEPCSPYAWQRWAWRWEASQPGYFLIRARATDVKGNTQPTFDRWEWNYHGFGNNSIHAVPVEVRLPTLEEQQDFLYF